MNAIYQLSFLNKKEEDMIWKDLLKKIKVFKDLSSEEINLVEKLVKERVYDAGTKVIKEGAPSTEFFICIDGELIIQIDVPVEGLSRLVQ